jgi:hypothetical protein
MNVTALQQLGAQGEPETLVELQKSTAEPNERVRPLCAFLKGASAADPNRLTVAPALWRCSR